MIGLRVPFVYVNIGDPRHWASTPGRRLRVGVLLRRARGVVAISPRSRDVLVADYGLVPDRVWVVANGRSGWVYRPSSEDERSAARARLGLPGDGTVVVTAGALSREKRVDVAVLALQSLPEAILIVAGEGPERGRLEALAATVAPGRVRFLGAIPSVVDVLAAADLLVLASDSEGVPGILIEAGLAGVPVVATDVGFVREVVVPGWTGELVPRSRPDAVAAAVAKVLAARESYSVNARDHCVANFEIRSIADQWEQLLTAVRPN